MKRGFELAVNTFVVLILGAVLLVVGILFLRSITDTGEDFVNSISANDRNEISSLLNRGDVVAVARASRTNALFDKPLYFGIGIKNIAEESHEFVPVVEFNKAIGNEGSELSIHDDIKILMLDYKQNRINLGPGESKDDIPLSITIPKGFPRGTYIFSVYVYYDKDGDGTIMLNPNSGYLYDRKSIRISMI